MKKIILVDGNNLMFRSFYATLYSGQLMKTTGGVFTNAVYGLVNMLKKIITEEKPKYMLVAFDKGKTFRHDKYAEYKAGRIEMPVELRGQFEIAKQVLTAMGIYYYEEDNYEADDIIGTIAKSVDLEDEFIATIVSSDKDLLQLISNEVDIKLLKQKDYIRYDVDTFIKNFGFEPINIIDLKALQGDASDNIKGVKGIGEKTALKLIGEYKTIENLYDNIDQIKGALHDKLKLGYEDALVSKDLCTIYRDMKLPFSLEELKYNGGDSKVLNALFNELEFTSMLVKDEAKSEIKVNYIEDIEDLKLADSYALYLELDNKNYHLANIVGVGYADNNQVAFIDSELFQSNLDYFKGDITTYNVKGNLILLGDKFKFIDDIMLMAYVANYIIKDDISTLANNFGYNLNHYDKKLGVLEQRDNIALKAYFINSIKDDLKTKLVEEELEKVYSEIELPLTYTLLDMEKTGVVVDSAILDNIHTDLTGRLNTLETEIYKLAGVEFNIASPKQLAVILFEELGLKGGKKTKTGYSTDKDVLDRIKGQHPVVEKIVEYRTLAKVNSTYAIGLRPYVFEDCRVHPIFSQTIARTGRLSCMEPNLQNIPIRNEEGRIIRKAFLPTHGNVLMGCDYSQIELRIFAHLSGVESLVEAFRSGRDIHTQTAMDIYSVACEDVTKEMRRVAKAVNFGIIYGISGFGLSNNLDIDFKEAKNFIDKYLETFPGVKKYMADVIVEAKAKGFVKTLYGRKRVIEELSSNNYMVRSMGERIALNTPIQGTSADIIKVAMIRIEDKFKKLKLKSKMIIQVHDELIFDVVVSEKDVVSQVVKEIMENVIKLDVPLDVSLDFGKDWYDVK